MGRHQTFQQGSAAGQTSRPDRLLRSATRSHLVLLVRLAQQPLIFWGSIWIATLMLIGLTLGALLNPGFVNPQVASSPVAKPIQAVIPFENTAVSTLEPTTDQITVPVSSSTAGTSLWSLGAIALSCAAGSLLLARYLNRTPNLNQTPKAKRFKDKSAEVSTLNSVAAIQPLQPAQLCNQPISSVVVPVVDYQMPPVLKPSASRNGVNTRSSPPKALVGNSIDLPDLAKAIVTVVPSDQSHPLDWDEASLASTMDIRKRHPLSSWM